MSLAFAIVKPSGRRPSPRFLGQIPRSIFGTGRDARAVPKSRRARSRSGSRVEVEQAAEPFPPQDRSVRVRWRGGTGNELVPNALMVPLEVVVA